MSFWRDRQFRHFYVFLMGVLAALTVFVAVIWMMYGRLSKEMYLSHNRSVVSSLLEAGVERNVIARAFAADASSPEGEALVEMMGLGENAKAAFLPGIAGMQSKMAVCMTGFVMSLWFVQMAGAGFFFSDREKVYAEAEKTVRKFAEGDFSENISYLEEGRLHQLFGSVDHLAKALAAQSEMTGRAKAFLKDTISDISHQLKTPLAALEMYCEIILAEPENTEIVIKFTKKASEALIRMERLILALLKIARLDAGAVIFEKKDYSVGDVVKRGIEELAVRAQREGKEILLSGQDSVSVNCDLQWTGEALGNLVKNALDYTREGAKIEISWEELADAVRVSVIDDGEGIGEEMFYHMFKRFYRVGKGNGIGLGLPLTKSVMEGQGGMLSAHNIPGGGAAFVMTFPMKLKEL